jgi:hypothetical protein
VRVLGFVVEVAAGPVLHFGQQFALGHTVAAQAIGHEAPRLVLQASEQAFEEPLRSTDIATILDQDVEHDAVLVHRAPEIVQLAIDLQEYLIQVPGVAWLGPTSAKLPGKVGAEGEAPRPNALVSDGDTPLGQDQLDVSEA